MKKLNPIENKILIYLLKRKTFATTTQIAKGAKVSWNTAESYLDLFNIKGWISLKTHNRRKYWKVGGK